MNWVAPIKDEETLEKEVMLLEEDPIEAVCKIEDTEYETLDEAVLAAEDGQTILLFLKLNMKAMHQDIMGKNYQMHIMHI